MKQKSRKRTRFVAILLCITTLLTTLPTVALPVFADGKQTAHDNPWDYTVFGNSIEFPMDFFSGSSVSVSGDAHANNSIRSISKTFDAGTVEAGQNVTLNAQTTDVEGVVEGASNIDLPQIYYSMTALEGGKARSKIASDTSAKDMLRTSIISDEDINIDLRGSYPKDMQIYTKKAGAFGAAFLTEVYENPEKWQNILPVFAEKIETNDNGKTDIIGLSDKSYFAATQDTSVNAEKYSGWDNLPDTVFMNNLNGQYVAGYLNDLKENQEFPDNDNTSTVIDAAWDKSSVNPTDAAEAEKITVTGGNFTLDGDYGNLKELRLNNNGSAQLLGNYDKLEYIYTDNYINLNLAGNFPSLKCVYMPGGQLLLGTANKGFTASGASIINQNGSITVYTAKDVSLNGCEVATNGKIAIRGKSGSNEASKFRAASAMFAAGNTIVLGDMNDNNTEVWDDLPSFVSQSGISIINCTFDRLQGAFLSRNDKMKIAGCDIDTLDGFIYSQKGIDGTDKTATEGVYVETENFNLETNVPTGNYQPTAGENADVGGIKHIEYAQLPSKLTKVPGVSKLLEECVKTKDSDGKYVQRYDNGLLEDEENVIYIMSKGNITINADLLNTPKGRRMIIASRNGNVKINASCHNADADKYYSSSEFDGVIYAPKGKVEYISDEGLNIKGRVYAADSFLSGYWVNVASQNSDLDLINVREQFKLDDSNYEYEKSYNTYYLKNSALNDSITGSLHTMGETEKISYKVQKLNYFTTGWHEPYIEGEIDSDSRYFTVDNAVLRIGLNKITFTTELKNGKIIKNEFNVIYFDENALDTNDNDGDKLLNWQEEFYDTDKNKVDTDGDGLSDYDEIYLLGLNPLALDSDNNGVTDDNEDFDGDGLTNGEELNGVKGYTSDPTVIDTDGDTIDDYTEVYRYGTDPSNKDTDGDGVDDNIEIEIGSNPLVAESSFKRTVTQKSESKKMTAKVTAYGASGVAANTLSVSESENPFVTSSMPGYIEQSFEFSAEGTFETAEISFTMDNMPSGARIYYIDNDNHKLEALDCTRNGNTISATVNHFSEYIVVDENDYNKAFTEIPLYTETRKQPLDVVVAVSRALTDPENLRYKIYKDIANKLDANENDRIALVFGDGIYNGDYYKQVYRTFDDSLNSSLIPAENVFNLNPLDYIDDKSYTMSLLNEGLRLFPVKNGSGYRANSKKILIIMDSGIDERFPNGMDGNSIVDAVKDENIFVDEIIAIGFEDVNGKYNFKKLKEFADKCYTAASKDFSFSVPSVKNQIDYDSKINSGGKGKYDNDIAKMLWNGTIRDMYGNKVFGDNLSLDKCKADADPDGDGLANYQEINIKRAGNTFEVWYNSDPKNPDTDGDGIGDGEDEFALKRSAIQTYDNGVLKYDGVDYEIFVPNDMEEKLYPYNYVSPWKTFRIVSENEFNFDIAKFVAGISLSDTSNKPIFTGPDDWKGKDVEIYGSKTNICVSGISAGLNLINGALLSISQMFMKVEFQETDAGQKRVIIKVGNTRAAELFNVYATGSEIYGKNSTGKNVVANKAKMEYARITGKEPNQSKKYDIKIVISPKHKEDNGLYSYLWISHDNKIMETTIAYGNDEVQIGTYEGGFFDKEFVPVYTYSDEEIRNSYVASTDNIELYQKIIKRIEDEK